MIGSIYFLFVAVSCLLLYVAPFLWPLVLIAQSGTLLTYYHKTKGFVLSLLGLFAYAIFDYERLLQQTFLFYFLGSLLVSWLIEAFVRHHQEDSEAKVCEFEALLEREKLESHRWMKEAATLDQSLQRLEVEKDQRKEIPKDQNVLLSEYALIQSQHTDLCQELEDKALALEHMQKGYLALETQLLTFQKEQEEKSLDDRGLSAVLHSFLVQIQNLEEEIQALENVVTVSLGKVKKVSRSKKVKTLNLSQDAFL